MPEKVDFLIPDGIHRDIVLKISQDMGFDGIIIYEIDQDGRLWARHAQGLDIKDSLYYLGRLPQADRIMDIAIKEQKEQIILNPQDDARSHPQKIKLHNGKPFNVIPIIYNNKVIAMISVTYKDTIEESKIKEIINLSRTILAPLFEGKHSDTDIRDSHVANAFDSRFYDENLGSEIILNGQRVIMLGSVNYLGLSHHPSIIKATLEATERFGAGGLGSRASNGCLKLHKELDISLAKFMGKEKAIVFNSGYMANLGIISSAFGRKALIFTDKESHLSIYDACQMSGLKYFRYRQNDMDHLESFLKRYKYEDEKWIVVVGTFGVTGKRANLVEIVQLARKYGARIYFDDAHSIGVFGKNKRGLAEECDVLEEIDLIMGSFQMAFGNIGAFVAGKESLINTIRIHSRPYIFSYGLPASNVAAILESIRILESEEGDQLIKKLWKNITLLRNGLHELDFSIISDDTQLTSVVLGEEERTLYYWDQLLKEGLWVQIYLHPAVPKDKSVMRLTCMATHSEEHIVEAIRILSHVVQREKMVLSKTSL